MKPTQNNKALTLVEVMLALVIVAMLAATTMMVVGNITRSEARARTQHDDSWLLSPLRDILTADLVHAGEIDKTPKGFSIQTQVSFDAATLERKHLPTTVDYAVRKIGSRNWLVRIQHALTAGQDMTELICSGVRSFNVEKVDPADAEAASQPACSGTVVTVEFDSAQSAPLVFTVWQG